MAISPNHVTIKEARLSYASVWEPRGFNGDETNAKYSASLIIKKTDKVNIERIKAAIQAAYEKGKDKLKNGSRVLPLAEIRNPLRDGDKDRPDDEAYKGCYFLTASSTDAPRIVDGMRQEILEREKVYSGCYCNVGVDFFVYNHMGNKGIACGLGNIQKVRDGERFDGRATVEEEFEDLVDEDEYDLMG